MYIAQLGRQPELSLAELAAVFGGARVRQIAPDFAEIETSALDISQFGGTIKCAEVTHAISAQKDDNSNFLAVSKTITDHYSKLWRSTDGKVTLGISAYDLRVSPRTVQKTGIILKNTLKKSGVSLRLIPNDESALSTATSHNNKLGTNERKVELLVVKTTDRRILIAESRGVQNITAYTRRDHGRPKRDAFVGMLPPKLAQIMLNLALGDTSTRPPGWGEPHILDPFCGTGTVLQEALLQGCFVYGSDLNPKMIDYTIQNLDWLQKTQNTTGTILTIREADATTYQWLEAPNLDAIVCETYLGQPFSAPPSPAKLKEVVGNCNHIITSFLRNIHPQLKPSTPLCIAVPAWRGTEGRFTHLPLLRHLKELGYTSTIPPLLYHRPEQVVAREILVLKTK